MSETFATVEEAIEDLRAGKFILITDDADRENEGDLIIAAEFADAAAINFMATHGRGLICMPMEGERLDELQLGPMSQNNTDRHGTAYTISVDARNHTTTGISAADRAETVKTLISPDSKPADLLRPGHLFPLRGHEGGVLVRAGHTEAAIDICRLAGLYPAAVICEVLNQEGDSAHLPELSKLAREHNIKILSIERLIGHRRRYEKIVERVAEARLPTHLGEFRCVAYESTIDELPYLALVKGELSPEKPALVRVHSGCLTGDALMSMRCDCGDQLHAAMRMIQESESGVLLYIYHHEGRGIGILNKIRAYALQDAGEDTQQANISLGFKPDEREYGTAAQVLYDLGIRKMRLLTNNPQKIIGLEGHGLSIIERMPIESPANEENRFYLETKRDKMGHILDCHL